MKKCPTCGKEFEDSLKFCQIDGAELVGAEPAFDPYATVVGHKIDLKPAVPDEKAVEEVPAEILPEVTAVEVVGEPIHETTGSIPIAPPDEVLEMPGLDPLKTMYVSPTELQEVLGNEEPSSPNEEPVADFGAPAAPPSPFAMPETPAAEPLGEMETVLATPSVSPFQAQEPAPVAEWTPPPAPDAAWQNQEIGSNTPFQPPPAGTVGENKILPIISLVLGIVSLCCYMAPVTGLAALVTGFLGLKNINNDPSAYGGKPLAIAGMILGGIFFLIGIVYWIFLLFFGGLSMLMDAAR